MSSLALACQIALSAIFLVSGTAKVLDRSGTKESLRAFRVPALLVAPLSVVLPATELLTACLLLPSPTARWGGAAAALLLMVFTGVVTHALLRGRVPQCRCFGSIGHGRVSWRTLVRNGVLLLLAAGAVASDRTGASTASLALAVAAGFVVAGTLLWWERTGASGTDQEETPVAVGQPHGAFTLRQVDGTRVTSEALLAHGLPEIVVFLSPGCSSCTALLPDLERWIPRYRDRVVIQPVVSGDADQAARLQEHSTSPVPVLLEDDWDVRRQLGTIATPGGALLLPDGSVAKTAGGAGGLRRLLAEALSAAWTPVEHAPHVVGVTAASIGLDHAPSAHAFVDAHDLEGSGEGLTLVDRSTGASADLDRQGTLVWTCLDGRSPLRDIVDDLVEVFGAPRDEVSGSVLELVHSLGNSGFLAGVLPGWAQDSGRAPEGSTADDVSPMVEHR